MHFEFLLLLETENSSAFFCCRAPGQPRHSYIHLRTTFSMQMQGAFRQQEIRRKIMDTHRQVNTVLPPANRPPGQPPPGLTAPLVALFT